MHASGSAQIFIFEILWTFPKLFNKWPKTPQENTKGEWFYLKRWKLIKIQIIEAKKLSETCSNFGKIEALMPENNQELF